MLPLGSQTRAIANNFNSFIPFRNFLDLCGKHSRAVSISSRSQSIIRCPVQYAINQKCGFRPFSSVGIGGSRGGGAMVDITSGPIKGDEGVPRLSVRGYGEGVFQINEALVHGSIMLLPKTYYIWNAEKFEDITIESLSMLALIHPTLEVVFIGCGDTMPRQLDPAITRFFKQKGIGT